MVYSKIMLLKYGVTIGQLLILLKLMFYMVELNISTYDIIAYIV